MEFQGTKEKQFVSIYRTYKDDIYRFIRKHIPCDETASDLMQETFFRLYKKFDDVRMDMVLPWLLRVAKNLVNDYYRSIQNEASGAFLDIMDESDVLTLNLEESQIREEQKKAISELKDNVFEKLYEMNPLWYEAVVNVYCLERPQAEVAEELEISLEVLHSRLYRAKQWIRKNYKKEYKDILHWI